MYNDMSSAKKLLHLNNLAKWNGSALEKGRASLKQKCKVQNHVHREGVEGYLGSSTSIP